MEKEFEGTRLTLQMGEDVAIWEVPSMDVGVDDLLQALRGLMIAHTFVDPSFVNCCGRLYEENKCLYEKEKEDD